MPGSQGCGARVEIFKKIYVLRLRHKIF